MFLTVSLIGVFYFLMIFKENADENDSLEIGVKSLFEKEISFPNAISDPSKDASFTRAESGIEIYL